MDTESFVIHIKTEDIAVQMMLKKDMIHRIMNLIDHYQKE